MPQYSESEALYWNIVLVDVAGFTDPRKSFGDQLTVRRSLSELLERAFDEADIEWSSCEVEDRGDGKMILVPPSIPSIRLVDQLWGRLLAGLRRHNANFSDTASMQLRVALHAGNVRRSSDGMVSRALNLAARILEAPAAKEALAQTNSTLAMIASENFFHDVISPDQAAEPHLYQRIPLSVKGTRTVAWLRLSDLPAGYQEVERTIDERNESDQFASAYENLDELAAKLLRRTALLNPGDPLDNQVATILLPDENSDTPERALSTLSDSAWATSTNENGQRFVKPEIQTFVETRFLSDEDPRITEQLRSALHRDRIIRTGSAPKPTLARDYWTVDDQLEYRPYAEAIAAFIRHPDSKPPLTIGVKGPWGAGKTSMMRMIRALLDPPDLDAPRPIELTSRSRDALTRRRWWRKQRAKQAETRVNNSEILRHATDSGLHESVRLEVQPPQEDWRATVWFNPWTYQSTEQVWAGLAHAIISQITDRLKPGDRERFWLQLNLARLDRLAVRRRLYRLFLEQLLPFVVLLIVVVLGTGVLAITDLAQSVSRWMVLGGTDALIVGAFIRYLIFRGQDALAGFRQLLSGPVAGKLTAETTRLFDVAFPDTGYASKAGFLHLVQTDIPRVLELVATESRPLVVFVDDLDRCSPSVVTEVIEAINLFLAGEFDNCVFVVAMEPDMVAAHIEVAYSSLMEKLRDGDGALGWRFLEKIVQLPLCLPAIDDLRHLPNYLRAVLGVSPDSAADTESIVTDSLRNAKPGRDETKDAKQEQEPENRTPGMIPSDELVDRAEELIRSHRPTIESLSEITRQIIRELLTADSPVEVRSAALMAADRIFAELYTNRTAYEAIESALPALRSTNPRDIKRYINLFRFYSFITFRQRLEGLTQANTTPTNEQLAKIAALVIRWPDLLSILRNNHCVALKQLEKAACTGDQMEWTSALDEYRFLTVSGATTRQADLKSFLAGNPSIGDIAHLFI